MANTRRALTRLAPVIVGTIGLVILLLAAQSFVASGGFAYDYEAYDLAARRIAAGQPLYPPGLAEAYNSGDYAGLYLYPPPLAIAIVPMTMLTPDQAAIAWLGLRIALLVLGVALLPVSGLARASVLAVAAISFPVWYDLNLGNLSVILFVLSAVVWRFRDRPAGSIALAAAGVLRYPFGLVLAAWLAGASLARRGLDDRGGPCDRRADAADRRDPGAGSTTSRRSPGLRDVSAGEHNLSFATTAHAFGLPGPDGLWVLLGIAIAGLASALGGAPPRCRDGRRGRTDRDDPVLPVLPSPLPRPAADPGGLPRWSGAVVGARAAAPRLAAR